MYSTLTKISTSCPPRLSETSVEVIQSFLFVEEIHVAAGLAYHYIVRAIYV